MSDPRVEWVNRNELSEVAEALGVSTTYVLGVHSDGIVIWTPSEEDDGDLWKARLRRDSQGVIIVLDKQFLCTSRQFRDSVEGKIQEAIERGDLP